MAARTSILLLFLALAACADVPDVGDVAAPAGVPSTAGPPIMGARGPLTAKQSKVLLAKLGAGAQDTLQRHLAIEQAIAETPLVSGNRTRVLRDGIDSFRAIFAAIHRARVHVNLEYFILEDVECDGERLGALLAAKRREGVAVNIIYDSFGSAATPAAFFDGLRRAGATLVEFNPVNPLQGRGGDYAPNARDHRKILVVDGATAIIGGVNLSTSYQPSAAAGSTGARDVAAKPWRDIDLEIRGPAVAQVQQLFVDHWEAQKGPPLAIGDFFSTVPAQGNEVVRIIGSTPDRQVPRYYVTLLSAIRNAERKIWLTAAYFVPTHQEMEDLVRAARRGVDVQMLLPAESDSELAIAVQHSHYDELLDAGVSIYENQGEVLHSKAVVVDGVWSVVGSSNLDQRSVLFNDEVDAVVAGGSTARELEEMFVDLRGRARRIDAAEWAERPISERISDMLSRVWQRLL